MLPTAALLRWLALLITGFATPAFACPVCGFGQDGSASTYLMTAVVMSIVPLVMLGGIVYYLARHIQQGQDRPHENRR